MYNNNNCKTECKQLVRISQRNVLVTERGKERDYVYICVGVCIVYRRVLYL